jgi:hypothetical protein
MTKLTRIAIIMLIVSSAMSFFVNMAYADYWFKGEEIRLTANAITSEVRDANALNNRLKDLAFKCSDYLREKKDAGVEPSVLVMEACLDVVEGYNSALTDFFELHKESVEKIELKKN